MNGEREMLPDEQQRRSAQWSLLPSREKAEFLMMTGRGAIFLLSTPAVTVSSLPPFTCGLDIAQMERTGMVLLKNAEEMLNLTSGEVKHLARVCVISSTLCSSLIDASPDLPRDHRIWCEGHPRQLDGR